MKVGCRHIRGVSLVEVLLAGALFTIITGTFVATYLYGQESTALAGARARAVMVAKEGLEAVRNIRDDDYANLAAGTYGLATTSGQWAFSGASDSTDVFTRAITIVETDDDRRDITSTVTWQQNAQRSGTVALTTRLSYWQRTAATPNTFFHETFPNSDEDWNGTSDTDQDESTWYVYQGDGDSNDIQVSDEDNGGSSPSGGTHLTFEDADHGLQDPEEYDSAYIPIDLSDYEDVTISYYWQSDDVDGGEGFRVAYSTTTTDGIDGTWVQIAEYLNPTDDVWTQDTYDLPDSDAVAGFVLRFSAYMNRNSEHIYIDDVMLSGVSNDATAPAAVADLAASNATESSVQLDWTAPGDDGSTGTATSYDVRYSTSLITEGNWASATAVSGEPTPSVAGSSEQMTVTGLSQNTTYYFAIKTTDDAGNVSDISNVPSLTTTQTLSTLFSETFPNSDGAWNGSSDTVQDEPGWVTYQGASDSNDVQVSNEDNGGSSPSGGNHLTFEDADDGFSSPEDQDIAYVPIDLSGYEGVDISYYWQSDDVDSGEGMRVAYSTNTTNGIDGTWTQIAEYINPGDDTWTQETYDLSDGDAVSTFVLRFSSYSTNASEHMYVDDIVITGYAE